MRVVATEFESALGISDSRGLGLLRILGNKDDEDLTDRLSVETDSPFDLTQRHRAAATTQEARGKRSQDEPTSQETSRATFHSQLPRGPEHVRASTNKRCVVAIATNIQNCESATTSCPARVLRESKTVCERYSLIARADPSVMAKTAQPGC